MAPLVRGTWSERLNPLGNPFSHATRPASVSTGLNLREMKNNFNFSYDHYDSLAELPDRERELALKAKAACHSSYSPYSNFKVGAAALLESGKIITASNQESEVFPAGVCAERNLLYSHSSSNPNDRILILAIASIPDDRECYPCGICRQIIYETQKKQNSPIKVIMTSADSATVIDDAAKLLPFVFNL